MPVKRIPFLFLWIPLGLLLAEVANAQTDMKKVKAWKMKNLTGVSLDRLGNFFVTGKNGKIIKYDPNGNTLARLANSEPTLIEPWYHPTIFIYNRSKQQYSLFDRNFENQKDYLIEPSLAIEPHLVCPTHDNKLWILDKADWSAKKVNPLTQEVMLEFEIDQPGFTNYIYLREYLNLLILLDGKAGILILNHLGKPIETIPVEKPEALYFYGEDLYYLENNTLKFFNLVTEERHEMSLPPDTQWAVLTDERLLTVSSTRRITLYSFSSPGE